MNKIKLLLDLTNHLAKSKKPVAYIAGDIVLKPLDDHKAEFDLERLNLEGRGYHVINPFDFIDFEAHWLAVRKLQVLLLSFADKASFQPGWQDSREARYLHEIATLLHIDTIEN